MRKRRCIRIAGHIEGSRDQAKVAEGDSENKFAGRILLLRRMLDLVLSVGSGDGINLDSVFEDY